MLNLVTGFIIDVIFALPIATIYLCFQFCWIQCNKRDTNFFYSRKYFPFEKQISLGWHVKSKEMDSWLCLTRLQKYPGKHVFSLFSSSNCWLHGVKITRNKSALYFSRQCEFRVNVRSDYLLWLLNGPVDL